MNNRKNQLFDIILPQTETFYLRQKHSLQKCIAYKHMLDFTFDLLHLDLLLNGQNKANAQQKKWEEKDYGCKYDKPFT